MTLPLKSQAGIVPNASRAPSKIGRYAATKLPLGRTTKHTVPGSGLTSAIFFSISPTRYHHCLAVFRWAYYLRNH